MNALVVGDLADTENAVRGIWLAAFGVAVRDGRNAAGLTQTALADYLGVIRSTVANVEAGRQDPPASRAAYLVNLLDVRLPGWLVGSGDVWRTHVRQQAETIRQLRAQQAAIRAVLDRSVAPTEHPAGGPA